ncbi:toll/interleukin-1 receptor domain-containing protein [Tardiphaga sp. vice304]|uniref:toll/interleukin-1 receptor domain-containing protein n=1 Tax=Tardiphaga sp. vice304 TaxID=2592817 RepID=UPI0011657948|nr:toll/interleukin-1 receptor domain-containing protein [Tardiphaga sp. vice304]QDM27561.1 toll/interleukin-1 receptor domain-containing protein [Tardiphaga sp. vice304]
MSNKHYLPSKLPSYFRRLDLEYVRAGRVLDHELIQSAKIAINEEITADGWNGGTYGHAVLLFLPESVLSRIPFAEQNNIANRLKEDLNVCSAAIENEYVEAVIIELADEADPDFQRATNLASVVAVNPDTVAFWKKGFVRLFVSHRDTKKIDARALADCLEQYGVSAFVAHDTIQPMSTWQREIEKGLATMELMLVFLTDDFHASAWTNQEVGYALGKGIPIITVKVDSKDPIGFIADKQAMKGRANQPSETARRIIDIIANNLGQKTRFHEMLLSAFLAAPHWDAARDRFNTLQSFVDFLDDAQFASIQAGFKNNDQLHNSIYLTNQNRRLEKFLEKATGKSIKVNGRNIEVVTNVDDDLPF